MIYQNWEESGAFAPNETGKPYFIPMPPPNITGILHMGHALFATLQDISIRYHRMNGYSALWLPGTDHAGLATQSKLNELMLAEGLDPTKDEDFYPYADNYKRNLKSTITTQLRKCGTSCDWSRETFTLDDNYSHSITEAMRICHDKGMLYQEDGQWYLDMRELAKRLLSEMDAGKLIIHPEGHGGTLRNFLNNIEPWCISRQIKWGHRMPIWTSGNDIKISDTPIEGYERIDGCLDTWFSSALWPFATLGWPERTPDLEKFFPADMIETGDDILFFWCGRMLMMGLLIMDKLPFSTIYLHGLILDKNGKKMSKSAGNGIDPLKIIEQYGCDGMRFALAEASLPAQDFRLWDDKFQAGKSLSNKLWNAFKFTIGHWERNGRPNFNAPCNRSRGDMDILYRTKLASDSIGHSIEALNYHEAALNFRKYLFDDLCGWYIESAKERLYADDPAAIYTLMRCLDKTIRMAHPFMPFITEKIRSYYSDIPLITDSW